MLAIMYLVAGYFISTNSKNLAFTQYTEYLYCLLSNTTRLQLVNTVTVSICKVKIIVFLLSAAAEAFHLDLSW